MGGKGSGRPPSVETIINRGRIPEPKTPIATDMFLPNQSGDHSAGRVSRTPSNETDIVNKGYVDDVSTRSEIDLFLTENASDIATYFDLEVDVITATKEDIVQSITGNSTTLIASFATILNEDEIDNLDILESGVYGLHIHAEGAVNKGLAIYCEFYKRVAGGTETLIGTTHDSSILTTSEDQYGVHATISSDTAWVAGDRIVVKVYGRNGNNTARNITIYMEGDTAARAEIPVFLSRAFIRQLQSYDTGWINRSDWTNVHMGSDDTLNADSDVAHNLDAPLSDLKVKVMLSTDGTDANSFEVKGGQHFNATLSTWFGYTIYQTGTNTIQVQTATHGIAYTNLSGVATALDTESWYYKIVVYKLR